MRLSRTLVTAARFAADVEAASSRSSKKIVRRAKDLATLPQLRAALERQQGSTATDSDTIA